MKTTADRKLLKLVVTETLLQLGFERATDYALNILTEVFSFHMESFVKRAAVFQTEHNEEVCRYLIEDAYWEEQYQVKELIRFMEQQISLLGERQGESPFHALKLIPKGVTSLRSVYKNSGTSALEERKSKEVTEDIHVDEYMEHFIDEGSAEEGTRQASDYSFDCSIIATDTKCNGLVPYERVNTKPKEWLCGVRDYVLADQDYFIDDFVGTEKYKISLS